MRSVTGPTPTDAAYGSTQAHRTEDKAYWLKSVGEWQKLAEDVDSASANRRRHPNTK